MFEQSLLPRGVGRKPWIMSGVILGQLLVVALMVAIPLLYLQVLPMPQLTTMLVAPPPPPPPPPPAGPTHPAAHPPAHVPKLVLRTFNPKTLIAPRTIPKQIATVEDLPSAPTTGVAGGVPGGVAGGQPGGVVGGILGAVPAIAPPPPPPPKAPQAKPAPSGPVRVGGSVEEAKLINGPKPAYPALAAEARVSGTVKLEAVIGKDGHVKNLTAVAGSPLLAPAAINAVKQWIYRPTYLNGKPVDVATEVYVKFELT